MNGWGRGASSEGATARLGPCPCVHGEIGVGAAARAWRGVGVLVAVSFEPRLRGERRLCKMSNE